MNPETPESQASETPEAASQSPYPRPGGSGTSGPIGVRDLKFDVIGEMFKALTGNLVPFAVAGLAAMVPVLIAAGIGFVMFSAVLFAAPEAGDAGAAMARLTAQLFFSLLLIAGVALSGPGMVGAARLTIAWRRGEPLTNELAMSGFKRIVPSVITSLIFILAVQIGSICCYIPGFLLGGLLGGAFAALVLDESASPMDAITRSLNTMKPKMWIALLLFLIAQIISQLGFIACGIGIIVTAPMMVGIMTLAFLDMEFGVGHSDQGPGQQPSA